MPDKIKTSTGKIIGVIIAIGASASVVIIAMIGFNFLLGSAQEKAVEQQKLITFLLGAVLLVGGSMIVKIIYDVAISW